MDIIKLKECERIFYSRYPEGWESEEMKKEIKKHKTDKMHSETMDLYKKENFSDENQICENIIKTVSRSSVVSMFEKPKFRDYIISLEDHEKYIVAESLFEMLHGERKKGFNAMVNILLPGKIAKWPVITVFLYYFSPENEIFVKPATAKNVIKYFGLENIEYSPKPNYDFYIKYRDYLFEMKKYVNSELGKDNGAFTGFLMMTMNI